MSAADAGRARAAYASGTHGLTANAAGRVAALGRVYWVTLQRGATAAAAPPRVWARPAAVAHVGLCNARHSGNGGGQSSPRRRSGLAFDLSRRPRRTVVGGKVAQPRAACVGRGYCFAGECGGVASGRGTGRLSPPEAERDAALPARTGRKLTQACCQRQPPAAAVAGACQPASDGRRGGN